MELEHHLLIHEKEDLLEFKNKDKCKDKFSVLKEDDNSGSYISEVKKEILSADDKITAGEEDEYIEIENVTDVHPTYNSAQPTFVTHKESLPIEELNQKCAEENSI